MLLHPEITRVLLCADGEADVAVLSAAYPSVRFDAVRGNCDLGALFPLQRLMRIRHSRAGGNPVIVVHTCNTWLYADIMEGYEACCPDLRRDGMLGAGDIIGSVYESHPIKSMDFPLFGKRSECTHDSILTTAVAETLLTDRPYKETMREFALENSDAGFGGMFRQWFTTQGSKPYNSFGNGSAMRVSPVGWAFQTLDETLAETQRSPR